MKAVIFAAGLGTRLRPITDTLPKPLVPVAGRAVLLRTLEALPSSIAEVIVVVGYKGEMIREAVGTDPHVKFVDQPELHGTYDALARAKAHLDAGPFLVVNGDDLYDTTDLERLVAAGPTSMLAHRVARPNPYSHLQTKDGMLERIIMNREVPATLEASNTYVGAAMLDQTFFNLEPARLPNGEVGLPQTLEKHLHTNPVRLVEAAFWMPVGTHEELATAERHLAGLDK